MATNIHDRIYAATGGAKVFLIVDKKDPLRPIGRIIVRGRATAAGRCHRAFVHIYGQSPIEGVATGCGYDMDAAAVQAALAKVIARGEMPDELQAFLSCRAAQLDARSLSSMDADNAVLPHYAIVCAL